MVRVTVIVLGKIAESESGLPATVAATAIKSTPAVADPPRIVSDPLLAAASSEIPALRADIKKYESEGESVALEDQSVNFMRTIQSQSAASSVAIVNTSRQITHTNDVLFIEQVQNINVLATEEQLVDFLYKLGSGASMIRVRDLELQPDQPHQRLAANIRLVASYQKNPAPAKTAKPSTAKAK